MSLTSMLRSWKDIFRPPLGLEDMFQDSIDSAFPSRADEGNGVHSPGTSGSVREGGLGAGSPQRLSLSFPKRRIFDYTHLISPFEMTCEAGEGMRWQVKTALRQAIFEKDSVEERIMSFAELLVLCGFNGNLEERERIVQPIDAIEIAEKYYKRSALWKGALEAKKPESERINLSKDVYASESLIVKLLTNLRVLLIDSFTQLTNPGRNGKGSAHRKPAPEAVQEDEDSLEDSLDDSNGDGESAEEASEDPAEEAARALRAELRDPQRLHAYRLEQYLDFKESNAFEEAYIQYKEKAPERPIEERPRSDEHRGGSGVPLEAMFQLVQAMGMMHGASAKALDGEKPAAEPPKKLNTRKFRTDADFTVQDKEKLIQIIYNGEASGLKFDRDFETLEAMVYKKPHQVAMILAEKMDDPVFYQ